LTASVEMAPVSAAGVTESAPPANGGAATATMPLQPARRRRWPVFAASVWLAIVAGAGAGWDRHRLAFPPHAAVVPATEELAADKLETKEQALRTLLEPYLDTRPSTAREGQKGLEHGMDLGLYYLEQDRLDDAQTLFVRLERHPTPTYQLLGH